GLVGGVAREPHLVSAAVVFSFATRPAVVGRSAHHYPGCLRAGGGADREHTALDGAVDLRDGAPRGGRPVRHLSPATRAAGRRPPAELGAGAAGDLSRRGWRAFAHRRGIDRDVQGAAGYVRTLRAAALALLEHAAARVAPARRRTRHLAPEGLIV